MKVLYAAVVACVVSGCSMFDNDLKGMTASNSSRYIIAPKHRDAMVNGLPIYHSCIEPVGPDVKLQSRKASLSATLANSATGSLSLESAQTLGQIYAIGDIMQFAHESLFRLCEAESNGDALPDQYAPLYQDTLKTTAVLLCVQSRYSRDALVADAAANAKAAKEKSEKARTDADDKAKKEAADKKAAQDAVKAAAKHKGGDLPTQAFSLISKPHDDAALENLLSQVRPLDGTGDLAESLKKFDLSKHEADAAKQEKETAKKESDAADQKQKDANAEPLNTCDGILEKLAPTMEIPTYSLSGASAGEAAAPAHRAP